MLRINGEFEVHDDCSEAEAFERVAIRFKQMANRTVVQVEKWHGLAMLVDLDMEKLQLEHERRERIQNGFAE